MVARLCACLEPSLSSERAMPSWPAAQKDHNGVGTFEWPSRIGRIDGHPSEAVSATVDAGTRVRQSSRSPQAQ